MSALHSAILKVAAVLWVFWGIVHVLAGVIIIPADASSGFHGIAGAVDPALLEHDYHPAVAGILNQHAWNLTWAGLVTLIGAAYIWRGNYTAIWVAAMVGGLVDVGYLVFVDVPGFGTFFPGTVMTFVSGSAILLSFWVWRSARNVTDHNT